MSTPTLHTLPDGVQHGTPEGYAAGCRQDTTCPALYEHGMACLYAHVRSSTDVRYYRAKTRNADPAAIARALGMTPERRPITPDDRPTIEAEQHAQITALADHLQDQHAEKPTMPTPAHPEPTPPPAPAPNLEQAAPAPAPEPAPARTAAPERTSLKGIHAWCEQHDIPLKPRGAVPHIIRDAFLVDDPSIALAVTGTRAQQRYREAAARAADAALAVAQSTSMTLAEASTAVTASTTATTQAPEELKPAADTVDDDPTHLDGATTAPAPDTEVTTPGEFAARWNALDDNARQEWVATLRERATARPEWGYVTLQHELDTARTERDEARARADELTRTEASALAIVLHRWDTATTERDNLAHQLATTQHALAVLTTRLRLVAVELAERRAASEKPSRGRRARKAGAR